MTATAQQPAIASEQARIERALEENLRSVTMPEGSRLEDAVKAILEGSNAKVTFARDSMRYLPDGLNTTVAGTIRSVPRREALRRVLAQLGLRFTIRDADIFVQPSPLLERMARRLSWQELRSLNTLARESFGTPTVDAIRLSFDTADEPLPAARFAAALLDATGRDGIEQLDEAAAKLGWVWRLNDDAILLTSREVQYRRNLDLTEITIAYNRESISKIIADLAQRAGVPLRIEPGVYAALPPNVSQSFSITVTGGSVRAALDQISGHTGLAFSIDNDGMLVSAGAALRPAGSPPPPASADPGEVIGVLVLPMPDGQQLRTLVRRSDISPQAAKRLEQLKADAIKALEAELLKANIRMDMTTAGE